MLLLLRELLIGSAREGVPFARMGRLGEQMIGRSRRLGEQVEAGMVSDAQGSRKRLSSDSN